MKQQKITIFKKNLLAVELPHGAIILPLEIINGDTYISYSPTLFAAPTNLELLSKGKWKKLARVPDLTSEMVESLVEKVGEDHPSYQGDWYVNYQDDETMFETALKSLMSGIESEIYWDVNPFEYLLQSTEENFQNSKCDKTELQIVRDRFDEAQHRTFDKNRTIIFIQN